MHGLAWKRVSSCSVLPPVLPAQSIYSCNCALFLTKWCGQHPLCFPPSVPSPLPQGNFLFCHIETLSLLPTPNPEAFPGGESSQNSGCKIWSTACSIIPPSGWGLVSHCLYSRLEKLGRKGVVNFPTWWKEKKLYFTHIFTIRWLHLCIQMNWTQYTCGSLFTEYREQVTISPCFFHLFLLSLSHQWKVLIIYFGVRCSTHL